MKKTGTSVKKDSRQVFTSIFSEANAVKLLFALAILLFCASLFA